MKKMILLINQCYIKLWFMIDREPSGYMTQQMTIGLGHIISSELRTSYVEVLVLDSTMHAYVNRQAPLLTLMVWNS